MQTQALPGLSSGGARPIYIYVIYTTHGTDKIAAVLVVLPIPPGDAMYR
jgi:hypothetical protein